MADQMMDQITFSVKGLTLRGFFVHIHNWVPFKGQKLQCTQTADGPLSAFLGENNVGNVPKEVSPNYKQWVKVGGKLEVVVDGIPKRHRTKGYEVPVIYVFTGNDTPLMRNMRNAIKNEIEKKSKRKKSLKYYSGDVTLGVVQDNIDSTVCASRGGTQPKEFSVFGMYLRGFHVYKTIWVPEIGSKHVCFISQQGAVAAKFREKEICGHISTDTQKLWRQFLKEGGNITATVAGHPKRHRSKGEEVPVVFVFTGAWTNVLLNLREQIIADIRKKMKKKKSLRVEAGDTTSTIVLMESASTSQQPDTDSDIENCDGEQAEKKSKGELSRSALKSGKRGLEGNDDVQGNTKKRKTTQNSHQDKIRSMKEDYEIYLAEKDFSRVSQLVCRNWELLGYELGLREIDISVLQMSSNNVVDASTIC